MQTSHKRFDTIESTVDFEWPGYQARLWINKQGTPMYYNDERMLINDFHNWLLDNKDPSINFMIDYLSKIPNINAIQVKKIGNPSFGTMVYTIPF